MTQARDHRPRALAALCVTEIVSWGVLYYAFPVLAGTLTTDTGWSATAAVGAFSLGAVVSAVAGVWVGRLIDRLGPRPVMTTGSVVGVAGVLAVAAAPTLPWFYAAWALAGVAQAATFYPPAFAAVTGWFAEGRVRALTTLTLVAGFSSTVFAPLTAALLGPLGWRGTYVALAVVLGVVTIPLHALLLTPPWPGRTPDPADGAGDHGPADDGAGAAERATDAAARRAAAQAAERAAERAADDEHARAVLRSRRFAVLVAVMTVAGFGLYASTINLVPLLTGRGASLGVAALGLGLVGAGQVVGRLGFAPLVTRTRPAGRTAAVLVTGGVAVVVLALLPGPVPLLIALAVLAGAGRGLHTLLQASAVADRFGTRAFGRVNGVFSAPLTLAIALAPAGGVLIADLTGGWGPAFAVLGGVAVAAGLVALRT